MIRTRYSKSVQSLIAAFGERIVEAAEREIELRTRAIAAELTEVALAIPEWPDAHENEAFVEIPPLRSARRGSIAEESSPWMIPDANPDALQPLGERPRTRRRRSLTRVAPPAALPSPEQDRRDAELARLRTLLKPAADQSAGAGLSAEAVATVSPSTDPFHLLQDEIRDQAHGLALLSPASCTARIASWAGRIRLYEEANGNRVAAEFLLDKLRVLAHAMDAARIEALNRSWRTPDWPSYIRTNDTLADAKPKEPQAAKEAVAELGTSPDYQDVWS